MGSPLYHGNGVRCWCGMPHAQTHTPYVYISHATREAGAVAHRAEHLKVSKYAHLDSSHHFIPVAVETSGVFGPEALSFIQDLSRHLRQVTGEPRSLEYLLQQISVAVQQGNAAAVLGTMGRSSGLETSFG